ncbi:hypothetical protein [Ileibacterium valens]|uniref:hypothetical protein n=1 Tax=Ileibacterium valens TaxID=1862668 RepID=UPI002730C47D|nr:hypothetical protein [Ileibacterium valens]
MNNVFEFILTISPAVTAGLFGLLSLMLQKKEARSKRNSERMEEILQLIKQNEETSQKNTELITDFSQWLEHIKVMVEANSVGVKDILRYMLQRFHATYKLVGYLDSHQLKEYQEMHAAYHSLHGNGTGDIWLAEVESLPIRDDLPTVNPYLEILKKETGDEI